MLTYVSLIPIPGIVRDEQSPSSSPPPAPAPDLDDATLTPRKCWMTPDCCGIGSRRRDALFCVMTFC